MYDKILVTLDNSTTDRTIIEHVKRLAAAMKSRVSLLHVVNNAAAQWLGSNAGGASVDSMQAYLASIAAEFADVNVPAEAELAFGDPVTEIVKWVGAKKCDLVAMGTHGHGFVADIVLGTTAINVQHSVTVPVLLLRSK